MYISNDKITPSVGYLLVETFVHFSLEPTNSNSKQVPKVFEPLNKINDYKSLGTSEISSSWTLRIPPWIIFMKTTYFYFSLIAKCRNQL